MSYLGIVCGYKSVFCTGCLFSSLIQEVLWKYPGISCGCIVDCVDRLCISLSMLVYLSSSVDVDTVSLLSFSTIY